jgi:serine/threonine protein phosphatase PrpC
VASTRVQRYERERIRLAWAALTEVGKVRRVNEDSLIAEAGLFAVADGMGGHAAGDVASQMVVGQLYALREHVPLPLDSVGELVAVANAEVREHANAAGMHGMGTTLVAAMLVENAGVESIVVVNVGDSRCYVHDSDGLRVLTHDHSLVQELVDAGQISAEEAQRHPDRNVVTRAIGADDHVAPDYVVLAPAARLRLLLCSDGVSGQLEPDFLSSVLADEEDPGSAVDAIIGRVLDGRAPDNATAIVVDIEWDLPSDDDVEITGRRPASEDEITGPRPTRVLPTAVITTEPRASGARLITGEMPISEVPR